MEKVLPKNWVYVSLQDVTRNIKGKKPKIQSELEFKGSIPYMDIKALEFNKIRQFADIESSKLFEEGDVAMVWDGARSGWVSKTNFGAIGSTLVAFKPIKINSNYLFYYLLEKYPYINSNARGVGIPHVDPTLLWSLKFPLPPLSEQNRIVEKLDRLFGQLEVIKISMEKIPFLLKNFRQQVLTQAVTGKLTEEWREGKELEGWKLEKLKNICSRITVGFVGKTVDKYRETGIPFLRSQNIRAFRYDSKNLMFIDSDFHTQIKKSSISADDVAIVRSGYPGTTCVIPKEIKIANCSDILVLTTKPEVLNPHFVAIFMNSQKGKEIVFEGKVGMAQQHFNTKKLQETFLPLPSISEQQEIVSRVESLFAKADAIEEKYKNLKTKIETLPQTILHKAFKGELSEQLETDGDARDLLDEIVALKNGGKAKKAVAKKYVQPDEVLRIVAEADATE